LTAKPGTFLLAGILRTPDGQPYHGETKFYRVRKGRRILRNAVDKLVLDTMAHDLSDTGWIGDAVRPAHAAAAKLEDNSPAIETAIRGINGKVARLAEIVAKHRQRIARGQAGGPRAPAGGVSARAGCRRGPRQAESTARGHYAAGSARDDRLLSRQP
jgi:hypothetical protein